MITPVININGTYGSRVVMKRNSGAAANYCWFDLNFQGAATITASYFTMEDCGTSSAAAWNTQNGSIAHNWTLSNILLLNCGQFLVQNTSGSSTFSVNGLDIRNSKAANAVNWVHTSARSSGTRTIQRVTYYHATTERTLIFSLRDYTFGDDRTFNANYNLTGTGGRDTVWENGARVTSMTTVSHTHQNLYAGAAHTVRNNVYARIINDANNAHELEESAGGSVGPNIYEDNVMHGGFTTPNDDDGIFPNGDTIIRRNVFCAGYGGCNTKNAGSTYTDVKYNTFVLQSTTGHGYGVVIGELATSSKNAVDECEGNIFAVLAAQTAGDLSPGFQIRTSSAQIPLNTGYLRKNGFWYDPGATATTKTVHWHKTLNRASYVGNSGASGTNIRVTAFTLAASTAYPVIKSAGLFGSVVAGDMLFIPTKGNARVESVADANTLTLDTTTANFSSNPATGDANVYIQTKLWTGGEATGSDADHGGDDVYGDPGFADPTRTLATWSTSLGGGGTELDAVKELVAVNGIAFDGTERAPSTTHTPTALWTYLRGGLQPTSTTYQGALDDTQSGGWIGAVEGIVASAADFDGSVAAGCDFDDDGYFDMRPGSKIQGPRSVTVRVGRR